MSEFEEEPSVDPETLEANLAEALQALIELAEEEPAAALEMFASLPEEVRELPAFRFEYAGLLRDTEDLSQARDVLLELVEEDPGDSDAHHLLAAVLEDLDQPETALDHFLATLALDDEEYSTFTEDQRARHRIQVDSSVRQVISELPSELGQRLTEVQLNVADLPTPGQVREGLDPRALCQFTPSSDAEDVLAGSWQWFAANLLPQPEDSDPTEQIHFAILVELAELLELGEEEWASLSGLAD